MGKLWGGTQASSRPSKGRHSLTKARVGHTAAGWTEYSHGYHVVGTPYGRQRCKQGLQDWLPETGQSIDMAGWGYDEVGMLPIIDGGHLLRVRHSSKYFACFKMLQSQNSNSGSLAAEFVFYSHYII